MIVTSPACSMRYALIMLLSPIRWMPGAIFMMRSSIRKNIGRPEVDADALVVVTWFLGGGRALVRLVVNAAAHRGDYPLSVKPMPLPGRLSPELLARHAPTDWRTAWPCPLRSLAWVMRARAGRCRWYRRWWNSVRRCTCCAIRDTTMRPLGLPVSARR